MYFLLNIVERKASDMMIVDVGINAVGWDYFPVLNLR